MDTDSAAQTSIDEPAVQSSPLEEPRASWGWRREHRIGVALLTALIIAAATYWWLTRPALKSDPVVIDAGVRIQLPVNLDPNTASAASLSRIPGIGEKTAQAIVDYRDIHKTDSPDGIVYRKLADVVRAANIRSKKTQDYCRTFMVFVDEPPPSPHGLTPPAKISDADQTEEDE